MKKISFAILAVLLLLTLVACTATPNTSPQEQPMIEEPVMEEPVVEEVITEEPVDEEVVTEEPTIEDDKDEPAEEAGTEQGVNSTSSGDFDIRNHENYWIELNGVRFTVGQTVGDFEETIFEVEPRRQEQLDEVLPARTVSSLSFQYSTSAGRLAIFTAGLANFRNEDIPMRNAIVTTITVDHMTIRVLDSHSILGLFEIGVTTQDEVLNLLGEPDDIFGNINTSISFQTSDWGGWSGSSVEFTFIGPTSSSILDEGVLTSVRLASFELE